MQLDTTIEYDPPDLVHRLDGYERRQGDEIEDTTRQALRYVQQEIPAYSPAPAGSRYVRTGRLGDGLGKSMSGGVIGEPSVFAVSRVGDAETVGVIGSNRPSYNHYVIGAETQAWMHVGRWWTMASVARDVRDGVIKIFEKVAEKLVVYINGR